MQLYKYKLLQIRCRGRGRLQPSGEHRSSWLSLEMSPQMSYIFTVTGWHYATYIARNEEEVFPWCAPNVSQSKHQRQSTQPFCFNKYSICVCNRRAREGGRCNSTDGLCWAACDEGDNKRKKIALTIPHKILGRNGQEIQIYDLVFIIKMSHIPTI